MAARVGYFFVKSAARRRCVDILPLFTLVADICYAMLRCAVMSAAAALCGRYYRPLCGAYVDTAR